MSASVIFAYNEVYTASDAFLVEFFGRDNLILWSKIMEENGFSSNHEFTTWILEVIEQHISSEMDYSDDHQHVNTFTAPSVGQSSLRDYNKRGYALADTDLTDHITDEVMIENKSTVHNNIPRHEDGGRGEISTTSLVYSKRENPPIVQNSSCGNASDLDPCLPAYVSAPCPSPNWCDETSHNLSYDDKPFKCSFSCKYCARKFNDKGNLQRHINTLHLHKNQYMCEYCKRIFSRSDNLKAHLVKCCQKYNSNQN